jgi:hypothetical protein
VGVEAARTWSVVVMVKPDRHLIKLVKVRRSQCRRVMAMRRVGQGQLLLADCQNSGRGGSEVDGAAIAAA